MQRTAHRCPRCSQLLALSSDMWGFYYLCDACAWTCEDDDHVPDAKRNPVTPGRHPAHLDLTGTSPRHHPAA